MKLSSPSLKARTSLPYVLLRGWAFAGMMLLIASSQAQPTGASQSHSPLSPPQWIFDKPSPLLPVDRNLAIQLASEALEILQAIPIVKGASRTWTFEELIVLNQRAGNTEGFVAAIALYLQVLERDASWSGTELQTLDQIASRLLHAGQPELAQRVIKTRISLIQKDSSLANERWAIPIYAAFGKPGSAMRAAADQASTDLDHKCISIDILTRLGYVREGIEMLNSIPPEAIAQSRTSTCRSHIRRVILGSGNPEFATRYARVAESSYGSGYPSYEGYDFRAAHVAAALAWQGKFSEAEQIALTVRHAGFRTQSGLDIANALLHSGKIDEAVRVFNRPEFKASENVRGEPDMLRWSGYRPFCFLAALGKLSDARQILAIHWPSGNAEEASNVVCKTKGGVLAGAAAAKAGTLSQTATSLKNMRWGLPTARDNSFMLAQSLITVAFWALGDPQLNVVDRNFSPRTGFNSFMH